MTNKTPIFTIQEPQYFTDYGFDPQIDYFQVLEEARKHKRDSCSFRSAKDDNSKKIKKTRKRWWKNALHFFKRKRPSSDHRVYTRALSGPLYVTESRTSMSRSSTSGPLNIPYVNLNELNNFSASHVPIYLVT